MYLHDVYMNEFNNSFLEYLSWDELSTAMLHYVDVCNIRRNIILQQSRVVHRTNDKMLISDRNEMNSIILKFHSWNVHFKTLNRKNVFALIMKIPLYDFKSLFKWKKRKKKKHNKSAWFAIQVTVFKRIIQITSHVLIHPPDHTC